MCLRLMLEKFFFHLVPTFGTLQLLLKQFLNTSQCYSYNHNVFWTFTLWSKIFTLNVSSTGNFDVLKEQNWYHFRKRRRGLHSFHKWCVLCMDSGILFQCWFFSSHKFFVCRWTTLFSAFEPEIGSKISFGKSSDCENVLARKSKWNVNSCNL